MPTFDNAHALIRSYVDADTVLDPGTYLLEQQLVLAAGERLRMTSEVTIQVKSALVHAIMVSGPNVTISGGTLRGMWEMTGQGTSWVTAGKVLLDNLLTAYALDWSGLVVENFTITRAGANALRLYSTYGGANTQSATGATFTNVMFLENYAGAQMESAYTYLESGRGKYLDDVKFLSCTFDTTSLADIASAPDAGNGTGNFLGASGIVRRMEIRNCSFTTCGRIALEMWGNQYEATHDAGLMEDLVISQCTFHNIHYREISIYKAQDLAMRECTFLNDPEWPDTYWEFIRCYDVEILRNSKNGSGLIWPSGGRSWNVSDNTFTDRVDQVDHGAISIFGTLDVDHVARLANCDLVVTGNTAHYTEVGSALSYYVVEVRDWDLLNSLLYSNNDVTSADPGVNPGAWRILPATYYPDSNGGEMFFSFPENTRNLAMI